MKNTNRIAIVLSKKLEAIKIQSRASRRHVSKHRFQDVPQPQTGRAGKLWPLKGIRP